MPLPEAVGAALRREGVTPRCWREVSIALQQLFVSPEWIVLSNPEPVEEGSPVASVPVEPFPWTLAEVERVAIIAALDRAQGDAQRAAVALDIGKTTVYRKLREYGLQPRPTMRDRKLIDSLQAKIAELQAKLASLTEGRATT